jgi:uncharacterized protein YegP (UPF0339 family)
VAAKFVLEKDPAGRFRFRLVSQGRVLASSESYTTKRAAQNAIASVKAGAGSATVDDTTQPAAPERTAGRKAPTAKKSAAKAAKSGKKAVRRTAAAASKKTSGPRKRAAAKKTNATKAAPAAG